MLKRLLCLLLLPALLHGQVAVTTRAAKGSQLTFAEVDANFTGLAAAANASLKKNAEFLSAFDFMSSAQIADVQSGAMTMDVTVPLQNAINACGNLGRILWLPQGYYLVTDASPNNFCLQITKPITIVGAGFYCAIVPKSTVGSAADTIRIDPSPSYWCKIVFHNFTIGNPNNGTRYGNRGVFLSTAAAGSNAPKFTLRDLNIYQGAGAAGHAFSHINNASNNPNGGMYAALIENCTLGGGVYLSDSGDSNVIQKNIISGSNVGILYSLVPGASCLNIEANNITATGGAIKGDLGPRTVVRHNNIEMASGAGSNGAIVDFNGANGVAYQCTFESNHIAAFGTSTVTASVRIRNMNGMDIARNTFLSGTTTLVTAINVLDGSAQNVKIFPNTYGSANFTPAAYAAGTTYASGAYVTSSGYNWVSLQAGNIGHTPETSPTWWQITSGPRILDGGTGTCGVIKPLPALQNSWVYYGSSRSYPMMFKSCDGVVHLQGALSTGTASAGTTIMSLPVGFRPRLLLPFTVYSLGGTTAGLGNVYVYGAGAGAGEVTIQNGGNTILSLDGISFLADGLANGVSAE